MTARSHSSPAPTLKCPGKIGHDCALEFGRKFGILKTLESSPETWFRLSFVRYFTVTYQTIQPGSILRFLSQNACARVSYAPGRRRSDRPVPGIHSSTLWFSIRPSAFQRACFVVRFQIQQFGPSVQRKTLGRVKRPVGCSRVYSSGSRLVREDSVYQRFRHALEVATGTRNVRHQIETIRILLSLFG